MKLAKALLGLLITAAVIYLGDHAIGSFPPLAKFIDPYHGFWQNAEYSEGSENEARLQFDELHSPVQVVMDDRGVPHLFAENDHDLYFVQGYVTARDRLWQMEFQTHAAAGRLSELVGEKALEFDLEQRRIGMTWAAENALELIKKDSASWQALNTYADGVNHYIANLSENDLPLEYKLLNYRPEEWNVFKSSLLLKYMAKMLTGTERDRPNTEALKLLGPELFNRLFPDQNYLSDPIVPGFSVDTTTVPEIRLDGFASEASWDMKEIQPHFVGSNNWAVSGSRTESGSAILCNDPHLKLSLPSIWYEIQLHSTSLNCYGVSLPGSPGITIGFNDSIAWGVTNAGRDVKDYYAIDFVDHSKGTYRLGGEIMTASQRIEEIKVKGKKSVLDTVLYTKYGPVALSNKKENQFLALRWFAHDPSNELLTFYKLNRASNFNDYEEALSYYNCPGQNFACADAKNNIAIWQQGKFKIKPKDYGKFILDGSDPKNLQERFIPQAQNPHMLNPERGFVSSANQPVTDASYPYYYSGVYEEFRNRTINDFLRKDSSISIQDMMDLQLSNYNLLAAEVLPILISMLDTSDFQNKENELLALHELQGWNYRNDKELIAPTVFEIWWDELNNILWDEFNSIEWDQNMYYRYSWEQLMNDGKAKVDMRDPRYVYPMAKVTIDLLKNEPDHQVFDHRSTNNKIEVAENVVYDSFYWTAMKFGDIIKYKFNQPYWGQYQATRVQHLMRLDAFSSKKLFVGGNENAPNATTSTHGPSWRMIVQMDSDGPKAWGVLPGGQSGNPGSKQYSTSLESWSNGEYHQLNFLHDQSQTDSLWTSQTFKPVSE
ncbi:MAG: penicillin acylase family protein [Flavobacteriales bacterium]|nr:penicillin acylase family protein [Flavobacteriales bacterium]